VSLEAKTSRDIPTGVRASPYVGLTYFTEDDAPFFFGREAASRIIGANLAASRLTLVYGPSGVGKSSLLRAGVARELRTTAEEAVEAGRIPESIGVTFSAWRDEPLSALANQVTTTVQERLGVLAPGRAPPPAPLDEFLAAWTEALDTRAKELEAETGIRQPPHVELLITLDQFEEYFVYHPGENGPGTFAGEFPKAVNRRDLRVHFLVSIRDDAYTSLDRFEHEIPNLFGNNLRVEHLDREAAKKAIRAPVARYAELYEMDDAPSEVEEDLVTAVVEQVRTGTVAFGQAGAGVVETDGDTDLRVEAPFLQLVMERLWEEEVAEGSPTLRLATLDRLGGAQRIVHAHFGQAMSALDAGAREVAASVFGRLVTPSGSKIAYLASDLAALEKVPIEELTPVLVKLADLRLLRAVAPPPGESEGRYEIFHDVLAPAVLQWRAAHVYEQDQREAAQREQARAEEARRRQFVRLLVTVIVAVTVGAIIAVVLAAYALNQKNKAVKATARADLNAKAANSERLTAAALAQLATDPTLAALLAERALQTFRTAQAAHALREALSQPYFGQSVIARSAQPIVSSAFSTNGKLVATAGADGTVRLRSVPGGQMVANLRTQTELGSVALSADGKFVAAGGADGRVHVWAMSGGRPIGVFAPPGPPHCARTHPCSVTVVAFSRSSDRLLASRADGTSAIWALPSGRVAAVLNGPAYVYDASWSPDGTRVVTGSKGNRAYVWDAVRGGLPLHVLKQSEGRANKQGDVGPVGPAAAVNPAIGTNNKQENVINGVAFNPAGTRIVTASWDGSAAIWDAATGKRLKVLEGSSSPGRVYSATYSPNGAEIVTASQDGIARIWTARGTPLHELSGHTGLVTKASFDRTGRLIVTASTDGTARIWSSAGSLVAVLSGHTGAVNSARFAPRGTYVVTAGNDGNAVLWRPTAAVRTISGHGGNEFFQQANWSPDGRHLVVSTGMQAEEWDVSSGKRVARLPSSFYGYVQYAGNRSILTVDRGRAELWRGGKSIRRFASQGRIRGTDLSGDRTRVSIWSSSGVTIDDVRTGQTVAVIRPRVQPVETALLTFHGKVLVLSGYAYGKTEVWQVDPKRRLATVKGSLQGGTSSEEFGRDSRRFATTTPTGVVVWDTRTGRRTAGARSQGVVTTRLNATGTLLVTRTFGEAGGRGAQVWDARTGRRVASIGPPGGVASVHFSLAGNLLAVGGYDGTTQIWQADTGRLLQTFPGQSPIFRTILSPTKRQVAAMDQFGAVRIFACDLCGSTDDLLTFAHERLWRTLTKAEKARYDIGRTS
jgi:WD40 repeat protein